MASHRWDSIWIREVDAGPCVGCGRDLSRWETGFSVEVVVEALFLAPALLEPLLVRRCPGCGAPYDCGVLVTDDDDLDSDWPAQRAIQAELLEVLREMLRKPCLQPSQAARRIRGRFGVDGVYVEDGSEVAWPLRR